MGRKATIPEAEQRTQAIYDLIVACWTQSEIIQHCAQEWGICERQIRKYMERARQQIKEDAQVHRSEALDRQLAAYRRIIKEQSAPGGSVRLTLEALKRESELLGLQPARKQPVLEALQLLVSEGVASPAQLEAVRDGIISITQKLRSPADGAGAEVAENSEDQD